MMDEWFGELLGDKALPHERIAVEGRVALLLSDGVDRWPYSFLDDQHVPPEFAQEMQRRSIQAGPDMTVTNMVPRPIELGALTEVAGWKYGGSASRPTAAGREPGPPACIPCLAVNA